MRWLPFLLGALVVGCGSESGGGDDDNEAEAPVLPGSTCEFGVGPVADYSLVRLDVTFPGGLTASEIIAAVSWDAGGRTCEPSVPLWSAGVDLTDEASASWVNGLVYARQANDFPIEAAARIGVAIGCQEAPFRSAQIRLDKAHDGRGKLLADCTAAPP